LKLRLYGQNPEAYEHNILYDKIPSQNEKNKINDALSTAIKNGKKKRKSPARF